MTRGMTMPQAQAFAKARKVGIVAMVERGGNVHACVQPRRSMFAELLTRAGVVAPEGRR